MDRLLIVLVSLAVGTANAATFTVTNLNDSGAGSLRDAVAQANANPGADLVTFNVAGTIVLTSGAVLISDALTVTGPGATALTIDGNANNRVFSISDAQEQPCPAPTGPSDFLVSISGVTLTNGKRTSSNAGGALVSTRSLVLRDMAITASTARRGGGFAFLTQYAGQTLTMQNVQVTGNKAGPRPGITEDAQGGAIYIAPVCGVGAAPLQSAVTIQSSLISGNTVSASDTFQAYAGGLYLFTTAPGSTVQILDSRIVSNTVILPAVPGSMTYNAGGIGASVPSMLIRGSELSGNSANAGGAMEFFNVDGSKQGAGDRMSLTVANSTISGNTAYVTGGGIQIVSNVTGIFDNSTFSDNASQPTRAGSVRLVSNAGQAVPVLSLESTIAANSPSGVDIGSGGTIPIPNAIQGNRSLVEALGVETTLTGTGNLVGVDPALDPLAFNGGSTRTQALRSGSPAINAGSNPLNLATDQRGPGFPRTIGGGTDMGAYEQGTTPPPPVTNEPIPTLSEYALMLLMLLTAVLGAASLRRRR